MKKMTVTEFKKHALEIFREVSESGEPVVVTRRGRALAQVMPLAEEGSWLGKLAGTAIITGDIVAPIDEEWDAAE